MVWTKFLRCDQMLMVWLNDISVWTNVHFLEMVWSHRMVWSLHMFFPDGVCVCVCLWIIFRWFGVFASRQVFVSELNYFALVLSLCCTTGVRVGALDPFSLPEWWRCNSGVLPHFAHVLRALLTNAPNSCPPERVFSMFHVTLGEDQMRRSFGDYFELALQSQYNKRNL